MGESSVHNCFANISTQEACIVTEKLDPDQMSETSERSIRPLKDTNIIKLTFCCKFWGHSLCMTLFGWVWYLWPKMASKSSKMSQEFRPSPWILSKLLGYYTLPLPHLLGSQSPPVPLLTIWDNSVLNKFNQPIKQAWRKELVFF